MQFWKVLMSEQLNVFVSSVRRSRRRTHHRSESAEHMNLPICFMNRSIQKSGNHYHDENGNDDFERDAGRGNENSMYIVAIINGKRTRNSGVSDSTLVTKRQTA